MTTEIKTETFVHPTAGAITRKYIYTYDGINIINKEFYVEPVKTNISGVDISTLTVEQLKQLKQLLNNIVI